MSNNIGLKTATIVGMNAMIGQEYLSTPIAIAKSVGRRNLNICFCDNSRLVYGAFARQSCSAFIQKKVHLSVIRKPWMGHKFAIFCATSYIFGLIIAMGLLAKIGGQYLNYFLPFIEAEYLSFFLVLSLTALNISRGNIFQIGQIILISYGFSINFSYDLFFVLHITI